MSAESDYGQTLANLSNGYADRRSRITQQQAEIAAQTAQARGHIWGTTLANLGQIPAQILESRAADQDRQLKRQQVQAGIETERTQQAHIQQQMSAGPKGLTPDEAEKKRQFDLTASAKVLNAATPENWPHAVDFLTHITGPETAAQYPKDYDPNWIKVHVALLEDGAKKIATREVKTVENGQNVTKIVPDTPGQSFPEQPPAGPKPGAPPPVGGFEDYVIRTYGQTPTPAQVLKARKDYQQADDRPRVDVKVNDQSLGDVKEAVKGMMDGSLPPILPGRGTKEYIALISEAHRQGYDLAGAVTDWVATQKHIATMNGAQQLRLNQAINQLPELLDSVDALAAQWKGGKFPILNKASLTLAKNGAMGEKAATIARQLDAQIADVTADLGNVYMGGNSPTDHALSLAAKALGSDWSEKVLKDMVSLARKNVQTRRNSINSTGVAGASPENPYAPPQAAPAPAPTAAPSGETIRVGPYTVKVK